MMRKKTHCSRVFVDGSKRGRWGWEWLWRGHRCGCRWWRACSCIFDICVLLRCSAEYFGCTKWSTDVQSFFVAPDSQSNDGDTGKDVDDNKKFKHCCRVVTKLFYCVHNLLYWGRLTRSHNQSYATRMTMICIGR